MTYVTNKHETVQLLWRLRGWNKSIKADSNDITCCCVDGSLILARERDFSWKKISFSNTSFSLRNTVVMTTGFNFYMNTNVSIALFDTKAMRLPWIDALVLSSYKVGLKRSLGSLVPIERLKEQISQTSWTLRCMGCNDQKNTHQVPHRIRLQSGYKLWHVFGCFSAHHSGKERLFELTLPSWSQSRFFSPDKSSIRL